MNLVQSPEQALKQAGAKVSTRAPKREEQEAEPRKAAKASERRAQPLPLLDPRAWTEPAPRREWNVPDWIPRGVVTALYGDGGIGKTLLAQQLLTSTALGEDWCDLPVTAGRALGIFCEDDENKLHRRQEAINRAYGCGMADLADLRLVSRFGADNAMVSFDGGRGTLTPFHEMVMDTCHAWRPDLLVLDTAADLYPDNENERGKVRWFVQAALGQIARTHNCGVLLLAHPSQSGMTSGQGTGGSTAWNNTVRSRLYLEREAGEGANADARTLSRKKANYAARDASFRLVWREGVLIREDVAPETDGLQWPQIEAAFDEIERAWTEGNPWSSAVQTKGRGRYFPMWMKRHLSVSEKAAKNLLIEWQTNGFLLTDEIDARTKRNGLRVLRRLQPNG